MSDQTYTDSDSIRILVATDNHVGYGERDPIRKDDSWKSFDEVMRTAKDRDVDMVLLAGDLFHDNKPSRQAMYQVMRSLRMNCLGEKPCQLEMLSDKTDIFEGHFNHVNYEDPDINVALPVFSIHGNHDDPTGDANLASLDILQMSGLINYYGRTHQSDKIDIKPVLLQKGQTKLALYGLSNVRDERLFRTWRDNNVKFFKPSTQQSDWFNIMSVHQNHHAYTATGYLPEELIPDYMDLVVWGHEHECLIEPRLNPATNFHVMQPGSSIATSLMPGEAVPKHVSIVTVTGREFQTESIRLKSVRPFVMKEIVLADDKVARKLAKQNDNKSDLTRRLVEIVDELIEKAQAEWLEAQEANDSDDEIEAPLPLIRLRVEYSPPESGGSFDCENPQRFSNRFVGKVANVNDVVQFHRRKAAASRRSKDGVEIPEISAMSAVTLDSVKVEKLVQEFLAAQSLSILPQNSFGDAVAQFVDKDDKHAMEMFVSESLKTQVQHLLSLGHDGDIEEELEANKSRLEELFKAGHLQKATRPRKARPKPPNWDTDMDGEWSDQPDALATSDQGSAEEDDDGASLASAPPARGRARGRGRAAAAAPARKTAAPAKRAAPAKSKPARGRKAAAASDEEEEEEEEDLVMLDDDEEEDESQLFIEETPPPTRGKRATTAAAAKKGGGTQTKLAMASAGRGKKPAASQASAGLRTGAGAGRATPVSVISDDIEEDDSDEAFAPPAKTAKGRGKR